MIGEEDVEISHAFYTVKRKQQPCGTMHKASVLSLYSLPLFLNTVVLWTFILLDSSLTSNLHRMFQSIQSS